MSILVLMIPMALLLGFGFLMAFLWATNQGQFDDVETPAHRILQDDPIERNLREKPRHTP
ncbi:cbb3-type cytochrome oxidase assembly protein CcoS [Bdellovibrio sp. HCB337]|uniref:cbb3-type cytochrome oxidase assembly protein CcoS n=1 Tax=Bdellovibrio sp. HCB337 TaxID=3394358 RepID=UPI0039A559D6